MQVAISGPHRSVIQLGQLPFARYTEPSPSSPAEDERHERGRASPAQQREQQQDRGGVSTIVKPEVPAAESQQAEPQEPQGESTTCADGDGDSAKERDDGTDASDEGQQEEERTPAEILLEAQDHEEEEEDGEDVSFSAIPVLSAVQPECAVATGRCTFQTNHH